MSTKATVPTQRARDYLRSIVPEAGVTGAA